MDYPDAERERAILRSRAPGLPSAQVVVFVQRVRGEALFKLPGASKTIEWSRRVAYLDQVRGDVVLSLIARPLNAAAQRLL